MLIFGTMVFNPQYKQTVVEGVKKALKQGKKEEALSRYKRAKESMQQRRSLMSNLRNGLFMTLGILSAGFGLEGFLIPNGLIDGGITGISLLTNKQTNISISIL